MNALLLTIGIFIVSWLVTKFLMPIPPKKNAEQVINETQKDVEEILRAWNKK